MYSLSLPQRLDRQWYGSDEGYDESNNPFAAVPAEYAAKKERDLATQKAKRMSAQQRQINKVDILSLHQGGVSQRIFFNDK